jgi:hypothetical protein
MSRGYTTIIIILVRINNLVNLLNKLMKLVSTNTNIIYKRKYLKRSSRVVLMPTKKKRK